MSWPGQFRPFGPREKRLLFYLAIVAAFAAWKFVPRYWRPTVTIETAHYIIDSTATREQTEQVGRMVEILYASYSNRFCHLPGFQKQHSRLKLILYKDRNEFRRINPRAGWAEAFYSKPFCRAYFASDEANPFHWMLHEAVHQLNEEVAGLQLKQWLEEGLAEYFATSHIYGGEVQLGRINPDTYPVWWIDILAISPDLARNLENRSVIPLRELVTGRGGPSLNANVNLYYLHWWTLTHYLFEKHPQAAISLLQNGGYIENLEPALGPINEVERDWHAHVQELKASLSGRPSPAIAGAR